MSQCIVKHNGIGHHFTKIPFFGESGTIIRGKLSEIWQTQSFQNMEKGKTKFAALKRKKETTFLFY